MRRSVLISLLFAAAAAAWILSGQFGSDTRSARAVAGDPPGTQADASLPSVRVTRVVPQARPNAIVVNGRAKASRTVELRAEVQGSVVRVGVEEGAPVDKGAMIVELETRDRKARLDEANALLRQRRLEYKAAEELAKKGFRASTAVAEARALLDAAEAQRRRMQLELSQTTIYAPFEGVLESRDVEVGAYVQEGDKVATIVDLDPAVVVAYVSERDIGEVKLGQRGRATLLGGVTVEGTVRYVSAVADPATRSFKVELEVPNPEGVVRDGQTAELVLPLAPIHAFRVSPAFLALAEDGTIGVKILDKDDVVRFVAVKILANAPDGVWISGLPSEARLITVGHEFVKEGQRARAVPADAGEPS